MEFIFHITDYDDPALDGEAAELLVHGGERALLLQKKDLVMGAAGDFLPFLQDNINQNHLS